MWRLTVFMLCGWDSEAAECVNSNDDERHVRNGEQSEYNEEGVGGRPSHGLCLSVTQGLGQL